MKRSLYMYLRFTTNFPDLV